MRRPAALALLATLAACTAARPPRPPSPLLGRQVEVSAPDLAGREVRIADAAGRVRIVDFWASWCEPCKEQMPFLERLARQHAGDGLAVFAVSFDDERAALDGFLAEVPLSFPVLWDQGGAALGDRLGVRRLPTTLLIDRAGVVRHVHLGYDAAEGEKLERELRLLLAEPAPR